MNKKQATVLWVVLVLVALMGLVPPWYEVIQNETLSLNINKRECLRYYPIFTPPKKDFNKFGLTAPDPKSEDYEIQQKVYAAVLKKLANSYHVGIDVPRLGVQWATVILVGIALIILLGDRKRRELAPKERMSYLERMKRAGATGGAAPAAEMALDEEDLTEDDAPTASDPKHVFSDDDL
ncbi:MAG: hypothetical protein BWY76_00562 [bacterium ADurb.Bin429]|nr:MAG: hypothetical protein BWY76_00562 [bacterium ADurb.Bin429]